MKLHIQEGIKQVDSGMFITDYVGDVVNLFVITYHMKWHLNMFEHIF